MRYHRHRERGANPVPSAVMMTCIAAVSLVSIVLSRAVPELRNDWTFTALFLAGGLVVTFLSTMAVHRFSIYPEGIGCLLLFVEPFVIVGGALGARAWARHAAWPEVDAAWLAMGGAFLPVLAGGAIAWAIAAGRDRRAG